MEDLYERNMAMPDPWHPPLATPNRSYAERSQYTTHWPHPVRLRQEAPVRDRRDIPLTIGDPRPDLLPDSATLMFIAARPVRLHG